MSDSTAVTRTKPALPDAVQQRIDDNKMRNAIVAQIRGTMWGKDLSGEQVRAVAQYARENNIDPVRHVEILGGRIYLTAALYEERGAGLLQRGIVSLAEPDFINADARLDKMAADGDAWAIEESTRRIRERIKWGVPEKAAAAVVQRITVAASGRTLVGINWCGGGVRQRDPVGDAEPTKTAQTRAARRAWKQIAEVIPQYGEQFAAMEQAAEVTAEILVSDAEQQHELAASMRPKALAPVSGAYGDGDLPAPSAETIAKNVARHAEDAQTLAYGEERGSAAA